MAVGIKKDHDQVAAAAAALLMVFLAATFHFQALHARPVDASGTLRPSSHDDNTGASPPPPPTAAAAVAAAGGWGLPKRSSSPSGCTNYGPGGGTVCPPR
uniref:Uncharacterized protein n=1 Tax=Oryza nivara TaxID=4536 RepID=A0A0E0GSR9_ORYNI